VGGAGLIAGVSLALSTVRPSCVVLGVEPVRCPSFQAALLAGYPVDTPTRSTLADGLAVPKVARDLVQDTVSVSEQQIALAMLRLVEMEKMVVEGGGAVGLAAILPGGPLHEHGRLVKFVATISDRPGGIAALTSVLAEMGASVRDIYHERAWTQTAIDLVRIKCVVETTSKAHGDQVRNALTEKVGVMALDWNALD
ncbi:tryptophan synthase beta subunit-like PLP-dependent enzyme, partial [Pavlovales sp. CCMP2436]